MIIKLLGCWGHEICFLLCLTGAVKVTALITLCPLFFLIFFLLALKCCKTFKEGREEHQAERFSRPLDCHFLAVNFFCLIPLILIGGLGCNFTILLLIIFLIFKMVIWVSDFLFFFYSNFCFKGVFSCF